MPASLKRDLIANYVGQGWTALMGLAFIPVYIRYLGVEAYGLIGIFALLQAWMSLLDFGIAPVLSREMTRTRISGRDDGTARNLLRGAELTIGATAAVAALSTWAASAWLAAHWLRADRLPLSTVAAAISIMGVVAAARLFEGVYRNAAMGQERQVFVNATASLMSSVRGLGAVAVLAWLAPTIVAFFLWQLTVTLATCIWLGVAVHRGLPPKLSHRFSIGSLRRFRGFAGGMVGITMLSLLLTQIDKILLSRLLNLQEYGYYAFAAVVASALYLAINPVTQAFYPRFSATLAKGDADAVRNSYHQGAQLVAVFLIPSALLLAAFSREAIHLWTHNEQLVAQAAPILTALCLGTLLNGFMWIPYQMQLAHGHTATALQVNLVAVSLVIPAILWVAPRYGAAGAAWVWCALNAGYVVIGINVMYRRILREERWHWYWNDVALPLIVVASVVSVSRYCMPPAARDLPLAAWLLATFVLATFAAILSAKEWRRRVVRWVTVASHRLRKAQRLGEKSSAP